MPLPIREKHIKINVHFPKMSQLILFDNIHDNKRPNTKALHKKKKKKKSQMYTRKVRQSHEMNSSEMDLFFCEL